MSIESDADDGAITGQHDEPEALARELGEAITELPEYRRYEEAEAAVEADEEAQEKISEFEQLR
ncbi:MAG: YlbF family regulator, partial [Halobaculum sp.]